MEDASSVYCDFHPSELLVGVCSLCLEERLLILASDRQGRAFRKIQTAAIVVVRKTFSLRSFLRRHRRQWELNKKDSDDDDSSFISMTFEDNGKASWNENNKTSSVVVEHRRQPRWRRRVSRLLQLSQWKKRSIIKED